MNEEYIITKDQLKKLCLSKLIEDQRMEIQIDVLARPYKEKSVSSAIAGGMVSGLKMGAAGLKEGMAAIDAHMSKQHGKK